MTIRIPARTWAGLAIRRARADLSLVATSALVVVVAATVMVATAVHPAASASRSAVRALEAADPAAASVVVTRDVAPADAAAIDARVRDVLTGSLGPIAGAVVASGRSDSYGVAGTSGTGAPLLVFGFADGLADRARLAAGAWAPAGGADGDVPVVLTTAAAERLGLAVGDRLSLESRLDPARRLVVAVTGLITLDDRADPGWASDPLVMDGSATVGPFTTVGPLFVDRATLLARTVVSRATLSWVAAPEFAGLAAADLAPLAGSTAAIPDRLTATLGQAPAITVTTQLPSLLGDAAAALDRAGSGSTAVAGPLIAISVYALVLVAFLVADRRRGSTTLLRARGAGSGALVRLALAEAVILAVAASLVGVPLGILVVLAVGGTEGWGAGALPPMVSGSTVAAVAGATAAIATISLLVPTLGATGPLARFRRIVQRRSGGMAATRSGLDLAVVAVAALLVWQLRAGGAAATASGRGLGPLDMAAPAAALLAGAALSLRLTGAAARLAGAIGGRAGGLVPAVAGRSLSRRADAHARVALLVVAASGTALLCASLGSSWTDAQLDQAAHAVAADIAGQVHTVVGADRSGARAAYAAIPGVTAESGVIAATFDGGRDLRTGRLLAVPADPALAARALRADLGDVPPTDLLGRLAASRPAVPSIALPADATRVRVGVASSLAPVVSAGAASIGPAARFAVALVTMAPDGLLLRSRAVPAGDDGVAVVDLPTPGARLVAVETELSPAGAGLAGGIRLASLEAASASTGWSPLDLAGVANGWSFTRTSFGTGPQPVASDPGSPESARIPATAPIVGPGATVLAFRPTVLAGLAAQAMPALADPTLLATVPPAADGTRTVKFNLADTRRLGVVGMVGSFPGVDGTGLAVVDLATWQLTAYGATGAVPSPTGWWLATDGRDDPAVVRAVGAGAYPLANVRSLAAQTAARLDNPIADVVLGSLGAVGLGALLIATLGVAAASAQNGRARRGEVAILEAQGLTRAELAGWLAVEEAFPVVMGLVGGLALGAVVAALTTPQLVHALDGVPAVPPVAVVPALDLAVAIVLGGAALVAALVALRFRASITTGLAQTLRTDAPGVEP